MLVRSSMKEVKQFDQDSPAGGGLAKISHDWQDDDASLESAEDHWCIVSDEDLQVSDKSHPKGNSWDEQATATMDPPLNTDKITLSIRDFVPSNIKKQKNMLLLLHLMLGMFVVIHLAWDRYSWRNSAIHLEQELRHLTTESVSEQNAVPPVEIKEPAFDMPENDIGFDFDRKDWREERSDNVILDNCWVHARASVSFRECAEDAKLTVKEVTTEIVDTAKIIARRTWKAAKKIKKQAEVAAAEVAARRRNRPY